MGTLNAQAAVGTRQKVSDRPQFASYHMGDQKNARAVGVHFRSVQK